MWKNLAILTFSIATLSACAAPAVNGFESARQAGLNQTPLYKGACDGIGQVIPGPNLPEQALTLGPSSAGPVFQASAAPNH